MKASFALGLISITLASVSATSFAPAPIKLTPSTMGAVVQAAGSAQAIDPALNCTADYTLVLDCTTTPCTIALATLDIHDCTLA